MQAWNTPITTTNINNTKPRIAICIPYNGNWNPEWVYKTRDPLMHVPLIWCEKIPFMVKVPSLPVARDSLVREALKANVDYIFFLDADHIFEDPPDANLALNNLYHVIDKSDTKNGKMVTGLYRAKQHIGFNYAAWMRSPNVPKGYIPIEKWTGNYIEIDVAGLGCTLIDIRVFKELPSPWFHWEILGDISEDFYFFELAKKYGYNLHVFTDVKLSHLGYLKVKCDGTITTQDM